MQLPALVNGTSRLRETPNGGSPRNTCHILVITLGDPLNRRRKGCRHASRSLSTPAPVGRKLATIRIATGVRRTRRTPRNQRSSPSTVVVVEQRTASHRAVVGAAGAAVEPGWPAVDGAAVDETAVDGAALAAAVDGAVVTGAALAPEGTPPAF